MKQAPKHLITEPRWGFEVLLILLVASLIVPAYMTPGPVRAASSSLLLSFTLISSLYLVVYQLRELYIGIGLMIPCLLTLWWHPPLPEPWNYNAGYLLYIVFILYITLHIGRYLLETDEIDTDMVLAAISVYFLIGLLWAFIYVTIETSTPGSFSLPPNSSEGPTYSLFVYFSYVTLTTLGYGEMTPVSEVAQSWSIMESIAGQLYLTIVIARMIGLIISHKK
ncbi:MAG: potassium channel family protein [Pseudomonadales bacterium]